MKKALLLTIPILGLALISCTSEEEYVLDDYVVTNTDSYNKATVEFTGINKKAYYSFDFSKELFNEPSNVFSPDLAKAMLGLSLSSHTAEVSNGYEAVGFDEVYKYFYNSSDSIIKWSATPSDYYKTPMLIAKMKYDDFTLYSVAFRGTVGYEWLSDFDMGNPYENDPNYDLNNGWSHLGFDTSAKESTNIIKEFIENDSDYNHDTSKLFLIGHSKGGGVANLTAAYLNKEDLFVHDNFYTYTYETPNTRIMAKNEENYDNIFNLLNSADIVNRVPLEVWNYQRYGNDILLPYDFKAINNAFYKYTGRKYQGKENIDDVINPLSLWCPTYKSFFEGENSPYSVVQDVIALIESGNLGDGLSGFNEIKSKIENNIYANETFNALLAYVMESYDIVNSAIGHAHCQEGYIAAASVYYLCDNAYTYSSYNELDLANLPTKSMGSLAIANNEELTKVILPTSLNRIDAYAIYNNDKLTTLTIPSSVNLIGDCAFKYNKNLRKIYFEGNAPEGLTDNSIPVNATIYIHSGAEGFDSLKHKVKTYEQK